MPKIFNIIKDSSYSFSIFDQRLVDELEQKITLKEGKPYVVCAIRDKEIVLKPEEVVRHLHASGHSRQNATINHVQLIHEVPQGQPQGLLV